MSMDISANFKIAAGVVGQAAVDNLNKGVDKLNAGVSSLPGVARTAGLAMAGLGAGLSISVLKDKFDGVVESILKVKEASEVTGSSIEKIGAIVQASQITGDDFGQIEAAITKMNKALAGSDDESKGAAHALDALGLNIKELRTLDPADAFDKIAKALGEFEDGGGKAAVAMDIFGKSGAKLLPFMKDYLEIGPQISKVTKEQAEQAEEYERNTRKLKAAKQDLYRVISNVVLPVANDFVKVLIESANGTNGVKDAAKKLAADGSMKEFFRGAAKLAAAFLDDMSILVKVIMEVVDAFKDAFDSLVTLTKLAASLPSALKNMDFGDVRKIWAERKAFEAEMEKRTNQRWSGSLTPYTDALLKNFAATDKAEKNPPAPEPKKSLKCYVSRTPTLQQGSKSDPFGDSMNSLGAEAAKLQWQVQHIQQYSEKIDSAKGATIRFEVEQGKLKDLTEKQKLQLIMQADAVDTYAEALRQAKVGLEFENQTKQIDANTAALVLNADGRALAAASQELENKGIKKGTELYEKLMASRRAALERKDAAEENPFNGMLQGLNDVADKAKSTGQIIRDSITSGLDKAGDALANFVTTGKLNFASFARSVLADLAQMIAKQAIFNAVKAGMSAMGFANGGAFGAGTQAFAQGGVVSSPTMFKFAAGGQMRDGVMGEAGPEAIMPLKRGRDGKLGVAMSGAASGGGVSIGSIVVNNNGDAQANDVSGRNGEALGRAITAAVQSEIIKQRRPGGLLAA